MYSQFQTDAALEKAGIDLDYGEFRVKIARAGGSNDRFAKIFEAKMKPVRRAVQTETLENSRAESLLREAYAEGVILEWAVRVATDKAGKPLDPPVLASGYAKANKGKEPEGTAFIQGIEAADGSILPYTNENVVATLQALPDLFADIREQAGKVGLFRKAGQEEDAKN
jgi:hypothetical protein